MRLRKVKIHFQIISLTKPLDMIRVSKDFTQPPARLISDGCLQQQTKALAEKNSHNFSSYYYRDGCLEDLQTIYHHKCAYCETNASAGSVFRVDHYRPKDKVKDDPTHSGYYWLGYEWSNLLLTCETCNLKKSNHFPLDSTGTRVLSPPLLAKGLINTASFLSDSSLHQAEKPLILNPETDQVENHFVFLPDGSIKGMTTEAQKTIEICALDRCALIIARKKIVDDFLNELEEILADLLLYQSKTTFCARIKRFFQKLEAQQQANQPYSRLGYFLFYKFNLFFINQLSGDKQKTIVTKAFNAYKTGIL